MNELVIYTPDKRTGSALCNLLRRRDFQPIHYTNAEKILEKLRFGTSGVLVLDFSSLTSMAIITKDLEDVLELVEKMPVIILSPYSHDEKEMVSFKNRGYYILEKPVDVERLVALLQRLLSEGGVSTF